jgi:uracil-DNA glycosylase family 4
MAEDLHELVRQLRAELEWAMRVGIDAEDAPRPVVVRDVEPYDPRAVALAEPTPDPAPPAPASAPPSSPPPAAAAEPRAAPSLDAPSSPSAGDADRAALRAASSLARVREVLGDCTRCGLHAGRQKIVFGVGNENAEIMFVGEGPGADEDRQGEPFVGKAGQLLTRIIENGMGIPRSEVYIANIVKCRPPNNRDPQPDEVEACEPFLDAQIRVVSPRVIITLGKPATQTLLRSSAPISRLRGKWSEYKGTPVMPTFHPAYLLRNPAEKRPVWEDIQEVLKWLGRPLPSRS